MSRHRFLFHAPHLDPGASSVELDADESRHLVRVLRLRAGDAAWVTDGRGLLWRVRVVDTRGRARLERVADESPPPRPPGPTLALARIGNDRLARAVEQCVELGVAGVVPVVCERSRGDAGEALRGRLERVAVAAMKQAFRATRPVIHAPRALDDVIAMRADFADAWFGCAGGTPAARARAAGPLLIAVGPEAGFSGHEESALRRSGFEAVSASPHRLRSETAAVALVAAAAARALD